MMKGLMSAYAFWRRMIDPSWGGMFGTICPGISA
jgi:hypothetical protein